MIAKLEWTQSIAQQNIEQLHNTTLRSNNQQRINNNRIAALERPAAKATRCLNAVYWYQIFTLDSAVVEAGKCYAAMYNHRETI